MTTEQQYILAFNNGYLIAKYEAALSHLVSKNLSPANAYLEGFFAGKRQVEFEKGINKITEIEQLRNKSISRENDFGREIN